MMRDELALIRPKRGLRTKLLVGTLCFLTLGMFALPLMWAIVAVAPPPPLPPGIAVPKPSATPFDPESDEVESEESSADDESSPTPSDPEEDVSTGRDF